MTVSHLNMFLRQYSPLVNLRLHFLWPFFFSSSAEKFCPDPAALGERDVAESAILQQSCIILPAVGRAEKRHCQSISLGNMCCAHFVSANLSCSVQLGSFVLKNCFKKGFVFCCCAFDTGPHPPFDRTFLGRVILLVSKEKACKNEQREI